jgi:cell division transport system permease protein
MTVASILTIAVMLTLLGGAWLFHVQINTMKDYWYGKIQVSIFLTKDVTQPERDAILQQLESLPQVQHVFYESQQQAYQRFKQEFASVPALVKNTSPDSLPESFRVKLKDPHQFAIVASAVQHMPGVDQVADAGATLRKLFRFLSGLERGGLFVAMIVLASAVLLIFNTVRLAAFSRRRETGIMRLVGASDLFIQGPFVLETVFTAFVGGVLAAVLLFGVKVILIDHGIKAQLGNLVRYVGIGAVAVTIPYLLLFAVMLAAITSFGTLQRYLRQV